MLDLTIYYDRKEQRLYIKSKYQDGEAYYNVSRQDIPVVIQEYLKNLLTNRSDVLL